MPDSPLPRTVGAESAGTGKRPGQWFLAGCRWVEERPWLLVLGIFALALAAYWPVLGAQFIWDDDAHVTKRALLAPGGLARIWFQPGATQQYYPVLHSAFWLEHQLWGQDPFGYHLLNILLHASAACLLAVLLRRLGIIGAAIAALVFAVHPVGAESVAWVSEQKNTLSLVFYLLSALAYLRFEVNRRPRTYILAFGLFALALLTKTVTATLPAALLVLAWWRRGRIDLRRDVLPLAPWFVLGLGGGLFTAYVERTQIGAEGAAFDFSLVERALIAGRVVWFYLGKLLWPANLEFIYPRWRINAAEPEQYLFPLALVIALGLLTWRARRSRGPLAIALLFVGSLFPALGFFNVYPFIYSFVADHFQYLASLAVYAAVGLGLARAGARWPRGLTLGLVTTLVVGLAALTRRQVSMYRDDETLFETTIARNPGCWMAYMNLGDVYASSGRSAEALTALETALKVRPDYPEAESDLGEQLNQLGRSAEAVPHLLRALQLRPRYAGARNNLGIAYMMLQRNDEAMAEFRRAYALQPKDPQTNYNLAMGLQTAGRMEEAMPHFVAAAALDTNNPTVHANLALALTLQKRFDDAFFHFERVLEFMPDDDESHYSYGLALAQAGRLEPAASQFRAAITLNPRFPEPHANLARVLRDLGRPAEAEQEQRAFEQLKS